MTLFRSRFIHPISHVFILNDKTEGDAVRAEEQDGTVKLANAVVTVPPNDSARPVHTTELPMVIPESSMTFPTKKELAPRVVA